MTSKFVRKVRWDRVVAFLLTVIVFSLLEWYKVFPEGWEHYGRFCGGYISGVVVRVLLSGVCLIVFLVIGASLYPKLLNWELLSRGSDIRDIKQLLIDIQSKLENKDESV
jgi:hypothetical protein